MVYPRAQNHQTAPPRPPRLRTSDLRASAPPTSAAVDHYIQGNKSTMLQAHSHHHHHHGQLDGRLSGELVRLPKRRRRRRWQKRTERAAKTRLSQLARRHVPSSHFCKRIITVVAATIATTKRRSSSNSTRRNLTAPPPAAEYNNNGNKALSGVQGTRRAAFQVLGRSGRHRGQVLRVLRDV